MGQKEGGRRKKKEEGEKKEEEQWEEGGRTGGGRGGFEWADSRHGIPLSSLSSISSCVCYSPHIQLSQHNIMGSSNLYGSRPSHSL